MLQFCITVKSPGPDEELPEFMSKPITSHAYSEVQFVITVSSGLGEVQNLNLC